MFNVTLSNDARIEVRAPRHSYVYATDGSLPNPLESTYAALAGCAGVYARKDAFLAAPKKKAANGKTK